MDSGILVMLTISIEYVLWLLGVHRTKFEPEMRPEGTRHCLFISTEGAALGEPENYEEESVYVCRQTEESSSGNAAFQKQLQDLRELLALLRVTINGFRQFYFRVRVARSDYYPRTVYCISRAHLLLPFLPS